ncbi:MAG: LysR family transcriptional regulator [Deltaproteobacteria bacterium]|nr:LysR family transcriptional regulator [Deltaproteobacteria bacterium]MBW1817541.1 LysR family transcriptional regulator [Deltaproteobacteria bacterium]MBW2283122.1 LysR family transcriptional regulator [Deltaproteobacteria bacterium]
MSKDKKFPPIDFDLRQLEIFCRVVELESFSKAAKAVFLAQASVSERIATLENLVGARLLDRLGREVVPTKAGELLYKHAVLLMDMKETARLEMQEFLGVERGAVQLGCSTIPGEYILPRVLVDFLQRHPSILVNLTVFDSAGIESMLLAGEIELGIVGSKSADANLLFNELWEDELVVAVRSDHRWAGKKTVTLKEIAEEPFILREQGSGTQNILEAYLRKKNPAGLGSLKPVARLGTSSAVKEGIKAGLGISVISSRAIDTELSIGLLKAIRIKGTVMRRRFYLIRDKRRISSPLSSAMIAFLLNTLKNGGK